MARSRRVSPNGDRPITGEEFERMLEATAAVVGDDSAPGWRRYLTGLWTSGLRLSESLVLSWDRQASLVPVFLEQGRPMLRGPAERDKCLTGRVQPMAPEFALLLAETPPQERTGPVFPLSSTRPEARRVSEIISAIGKKARVVVYVNPTSPEKVKYASAHDFRRAFRKRWAARITPEHLQELMGHQSPRP
jgi:integrase